MSRVWATLVLGQQKPTLDCGELVYPQDFKNSQHLFADYALRIPEHSVVGHLNPVVVCNLALVNGCEAADVQALQVNDYKLTELGQEPDDIDGASVVAVFRHNGDLGINENEILWEVL